MNNDGSGNILQTNSLLPPHEWSDEFRTRLSEALHIDKSSLRNFSTIGYFDVIVTNPPFGRKNCRGLSHQYEDLSFQQPFS